MKICQEAGVSPGALSRAQDAVPIVAENSSAYADRLVLVLLTMTANTFADTLQALFDVLGAEGSIPAETFLKLFGYLAEQDTELLAAADQLSIDLASETDVDYAKISGLETLKVQMMG